MKTYFSGKKTYIVGILMIILGFMTDDTQGILTGIGFVTGRAAISKLEK